MSSQIGTWLHLRPGRSLSSQTGTWLHPRPGRSMSSQTGTWLHPRPGRSLSSQTGTWLHLSPGRSLSSQTGTWLHPRPGRSMSSQIGTWLHLRPGRSLSSQISTWLHLSPGRPLSSQIGTWLHLRPGRSLSSQISTWLHLSPGRSLLSQISTWLHPRHGTALLYPPLQRSWKGGILVSRCPSVCLSVCPSVDRIVSALYLQQYWSDPFHICTSYQATSEGVPRIMFVSKLKIWNFGEFSKFVTLTLSFFLLVWLCLLLTWVLMRGGVGRGGFANVCSQMTYHWLNYEKLIAPYPDNPLSRAPVQGANLGLHGLTTHHSRNVDLAIKMVSTSMPINLCYFSLDYGAQFLMNNAKRIHFPFSVLAGIYCSAYSSHTILYLWSLETWGGLHYNGNLVWEQ